MLLPFKTKQGFLSYWPTHIVSKKVFSAHCDLLPADMQIAVDNVNKVSLSMFYALCSLSLSLLCVCVCVCVLCCSLCSLLCCTVLACNHVDVVTIDRSTEALHISTRLHYRPSIKDCQSAREGSLHLAQLAPSLIHISTLCLRPFLPSIYVCVCVWAINLNFFSACSTTILLTTHHMCIYPRAVRALPR